MKILFILNATRDEMTGAAGVTLALGRSLCQSGQDVGYLFRDDFRFFKKDSPFRKAAAFLVFPLLVLYSIVSKRLDREYDIIDIASGDAFLYAAIRGMFKRGARARLVMRSHGLEHLYWKNFKEEKISAGEDVSLGQKLYIPFIRMKEVELSIRYCDGVVCLNPDEEKYVRGRFNPAGEVAVIPHGVSKDFSGRPEGGRKDILYVGDWNWRKGKVYLVRIFSRILREIPDVRFSILVHRNRIEEVLDSFEKDARDRISVFRNLSPQELQKLYSSHSLFLFPSIFEGFGCVVLEAMASGMAIIITDDFGWNRIIKNWENGVLVQKRDVDGFSRAAVKLLRDKDLMEGMGLKASETASAFSWDNIAQRTVSFYGSLLKTGLC